MTFPIDSTIPLGSNDPADDVPLMRQNFANTKSYVSVDHVAPGTTGNGEHKYVTFNNVYIPGVAPTNPKSILSTEPGVASSVSSLFFNNANGVHLLNCVKAFRLCNSSGTAVGGQNFLVTSVTHPSTGNYLVNLTPGTVVGTSYLVFVSCTMASNFSAGAVAGYTINSATQFQLNFRALTGGNVGSDPTQFCFAVIQF